MTKIPITSKELKIIILSVLLLISFLGMFVGGILAILTIIGIIGILLYFFVLILNAIFDGDFTLKKDKK